MIVVVAYTTPCGTGQYGQDMSTLLHDSRKSTVFLKKKSVASFGHNKGVLLLLLPHGLTHGAGRQCVTGREARNTILQ